MRSFNKLAICSEAFSSRLLGITRLAGRGRSSGQRYRVTSHGNWSRSEPGSEGAGTNDQDDRYTQWLACRSESTAYALNPPARAASRSRQQRRATPPVKLAPDAGAVKPAIGTRRSSRHPGSLAARTRRIGREAHRWPSPLLARRGALDPAALQLDTT